MEDRIIEITGGYFVKEITSLIADAVLAEREACVQLLREETKRWEGDCGEGDLSQVHAILEDLALAIQQRWLAEADGENALTIAIEQATSEEREACAKIVDGFVTPYDDYQNPMEIAAAIRARGNE